MGTALSWALGSFLRETVRYPKGPHCQMACDMVAMACSSVPGRCITGGCLGPGFYCWWTSLSNLESRMTALSETGPVVSTLLRWKNKTCKLHWLCNVGKLPVLAFTGREAPVAIQMAQRQEETIIRMDTPKFTAAWAPEPNQLFLFHAMFPLRSPKCS